MVAARDIVVVGAGVIGLTSAHGLSERGHRVRVLARDIPPHTTSNQAGAFWFPFLTGMPTNHGAALDWAKRTYRRLDRDVAAGAVPGLERCAVVALRAEPTGEPWWADHVRGFRPATAAELGGGADGRAFESVVIEPDRYLQHLVDALAQRGVTIEVTDVSSLEEVARSAEIVVNCTGLGARDLCDDQAVYPARGQIVRAAPAVPEAVMVAPADAQGPVYLVPRSADLVLGGTKQEHDWDTRPRDADTQAILARCRAVAPSVGEAQVLETRVGLRPCRDAVRLEAEPRGQGYVVHNYGHGGSGFTLSWGCAEAVGEIVDAIGRA